MNQIRHQEKGAGPPLVLIHGFCETARIWDQFADGLADEYRVLSPDLPGFGESPLPESPFGIDDIGQMVLDWMNEIQLENPVVIGHSLGGYVTLAMAEKEPGFFPGFGLFHSTAYPDSKEKKESRDKVIEFVKRNGVQPFIDTFVPGLFFQKNNSSIDLVHAIASGTALPTLIGYAMAMRERPSREQLLASFPKPVLLIAGEEDTIVPFEPTAALAQRMRFPFFCGLTSVGHMGMFENEPESLKIVKQFAKLTLNFDR